MNVNLGLDGYSTNKEIDYLVISKDERRKSYHGTREYEHSMNTTNTL
jgi:hypothetical protein